MKYKTLAIFSLLALIFMLAIKEGNSQAKVFSYDKQVILSTSTATLLVGNRPNRKYLLIVNPHSIYDCLVSTYVIKTGEVDAKIIPNSYGFWEETYCLYTSSYYAIQITSGTAGQIKLKVTEKE